MEEENINNSTINPNKNINIEAIKSVFGKSFKEKEKEIKKIHYLEI